MKIDFKHRSNLYLNCNRTSSVYCCNTVNVSYQQPTYASSQNQQLPTVTDQCMHIESYQNSLLSFRSRSFSNVSSLRRFLRLLSMMAPALNSLSTEALDGIVELKRKKTALTAGCLLSMLRSRLESCRYCKCGWSWSDCPPFRSAWSLVKLKTELDRSYSIECDHHIDHNCQ